MMATAGKLHEDFLICGLCIEVYQRPVTLTCQHSFCENCLGKYLQTKAEALKNKSILCPTCRLETPVRNPDRPVEDWAGQLKPGLLLTKLMDSLKGGVACSSCKEEGETTPATHWCSECEAGFCDACLKVHVKMMFSCQHVVIKLASTGQKAKRKFICRDHAMKIELFCKNCKKPLCTVCWGIGHGKCEDVVTNGSVLPEVKGELQAREMICQRRIRDTGAAINCYKETAKKRTSQRVIWNSEIEKSFDNILENIMKKRDQLLKKLADRKETFQLRSRVKTLQIDLQTYQQQFQSIEQALESEDEAQLFEMFRSSGSGAASDFPETKRKERADAGDVKFILELGQLKAAIDNLELKTYKMEIKMDVIDLTVRPVLLEVNEAKSHRYDTCSLRDVAVLNVKNTKVTIVSDSNGNRIKSFYNLNGKQHCETLALDSFPRCIAVLHQDIVAVSVPFANKIVFFLVKPELELIFTISTYKRCYGLDALDQSTLVVSSVVPPSVDILVRKGAVTRSMPIRPEPGRILRNPFSLSCPDFIHVTTQGNILVSDLDLKSVICLTQTGHVQWIYKPSGDRALKGPRGITSTRRGDVLVADHSSHKVVHLSSRGEFVRDILTAEDGVEYPIGLCVDGDKLWVANQDKGVNVYKDTFVYRMTH